MFYYATSMIRRVAAFLLTVIVPCLWHAQSEAHPHAWIDIKVIVLFNASGEATGLAETWIFDELYTAFTTEGFDSDGDGTPDANKLAELLTININALADHHYFTRVKQGPERISLRNAEDAASKMEDNRLVMTFSVPFEAPVSPHGQPLRYAVFDPTYYAEVLHAEEPGAIRLSGAPASCSHQLERADPDPEMVALAYTLDQTEGAGDGLGEHFAEWVTVHCD